MIILFMLLSTLMGVVVGAAAARYWQHNLTLGARERRILLDAVALLREHRNNPDSLTTRPRAQEIIEAFEASQRKDA